MAKRAAAPTTKQDRIEQLFADIDRAKELAFEAKGHKFDQAGELLDFPEPDLVALPKILELQAKCFGVLRADGKAGPGSDSVDVSIEELERLIEAAKLQTKGKDE